MVLFKAKIKPSDFVAEWAVSTETGCPNLWREKKKKKEAQKLTWELDYSLKKKKKKVTDNSITTTIPFHLWASQVLEVIEPVNMCTTVIERMNELMCDHSVHVSLLVNVVLTQHNLQKRTQQFYSLTDVNLDVILMFVFRQNHYHYPYTNYTHAYIILMTE